MTAGFGAFFAMWNGMPPDLTEEFELAHTRDHLADHLRYLGPNGILWARRHGRGKGTLPPFFAFYGMSTLDRLTDPANAHLRVNLSDWFRPLRAQFRDRIGHHCRLVASAGGGTGGSVATFLADLTPQALQKGRMSEFVASLTRRAPITAAHFGIVDWTVPAAIGLPLSTSEPGAPELAVLIVESFDRLRLAAEVPSVGEEVVSCGLAGKVRGWGHYDLSYALRYGELPDLSGFEK